MKFKRQVAAFGGALALVTAGASVALVGGASAGNAAGSPSSAFGVQSTGLLPIDAMPAVTSTDGTLQKDSLIGLPSNPLLNGGVVNVQAQNGSAESDVANLKLSGSVLDQLTGALAPLTSQLTPVCDALKQVPTGQLNTAVNQVTGALNLGQLQTLLTQVGGATGLDLSAVSALDLSQLLPQDLSGICDALAGTAGLLNVGAITTECHGSTGSVNIANLTALGLPVNIDTSKANSKIALPAGLLTITVNKQTKNANGTFTVDGLVVDVLGQETLTVTSATCGNVTSRKAPHLPHEHNAPTPHPVHGNAPVTG